MSDCTWADVYDTDELDFDQRGLGLLELAPPPLFPPLLPDEE
ncbi:hypothetical protein WFO67_15255 [Yersinia enterocolitica]|nr:MULTISPECIES: hypothetical protein [Yersinia]